MFGPVFEEAATNMDINFVKIDVDKNSDIAREYGVMTIPTVILFKDGKEVKRNIGFMSNDELTKFLLTISFFYEKNIDFIYVF